MELGRLPVVVLALAMLAVPVALARLAVLAAVELEVELAVLALPVVAVLACAVLALPVAVESGAGVPEVMRSRLVHIVWSAVLGWTAGIGRDNGDGAGQRGWGWGFHPDRAFRLLSACRPPAFCEKWTEFLTFWELKTGFLARKPVHFSCGGSRTNVSGAGNAGFGRALGLWPRP